MKNVAKRDIITGEMATAIVSMPKLRTAKNVSIMRQLKSIDQISLGLI
jgi:hypothetical protein